MNQGPVANYLVQELATADSDGANKHDRYGKLPLDYARVNTGLAASEASWITLQATMLLKHKEYIYGDEVGEEMGFDRDEYDSHEQHQTFSLDKTDPSFRYSMKGHTRDDNLQK